MKRRWKKFLAGVLSAALALNLAAPLALAGSSTIGAACSVTSVFLYPEYVGRVDGENVSCIQGEVSYDHGLLTFHGDVTLTTVGVADLGTVPLVKALSEKNLRLVANGKVTGRTKGNGIEEAKEIAGGEYNLTYADLGAYLDTKPNGILGGDTGTTITAGTEITLKDFHTGIGGGDVRIDGTVNITGAMFEGATYGIANFTTMNPGSELEIHADRYIRKDCLLTYNGGHLLMIVAENGDGNNIVQGRLSIGNDVSRFWYRTDENLMQRFFGFEQYIRAGAQKTIEIIRNLDIVDSLEKFVAFENKSKLTNAKKLLKAKNSPVLQMKKNDLLENLKKHSRYKTMFKFEEDHIVISSQKEAAAFIKMLNDDIVRSELTGKEYDSSSKMLLGPMESSQ